MRVQIRDASMIEDCHISDVLSEEDRRIVQIAGLLIDQEMQYVRHELETLRIDMHRSNEERRNILQVLHDDLMNLFKRVAS